jgi:hypothetical protein
MQKKKENNFLFLNLLFIQKNLFFIFKFFNLFVLLMSEKLHFYLYTCITDLNRRSIN